MTIRVKELRPLLLLCLAAVIVAGGVGVGRFVFHEAVGTALAPVGDQIVAHFGSTIVLVLGGLPAVVVAWLLYRRRPRPTLRSNLLDAGLGSAVSFALGLVLLRIVIWEVAEWLVLVGALGLGGLIAFTLALALDTALRAGDA